MNLALHDVRRKAGRFLGTSFGIALLFTVVLAMAGIYAGLVADATALVDSLHAELWVVQKDTRGPFADLSRLDPTVEGRVAALPGVVRVRAFTYQVIQREASRQSLRFALVGVGWPDDRGRGLPLVAGHAFQQAHGELIVDATLGLPIGSKLKLAREEFRVVGLTSQLLGSGGDAVVVATARDAQLITEDRPSDAIRTERERFAERLRASELGQIQPALESVTRDPRWHAPAIAATPISAVLVDARGATRLLALRSTISAWPDVAVYTSEEQRQFLLKGVVEKPRQQLALFGLILILTSSVLIAAVIYAMTIDKAHDIAVLKLIGSSSPRIAGMVLQQAWLMAVLGYAIAVAIGSQAFPHFPRRVVLTSETIALVGGLVFVVSTFAGLLGVRYALRVDAGRALEA